MDLIFDYGSESRWVGHYHAKGDKESEKSAKSEAERILKQITEFISLNMNPPKSNE